MGVVVGVVAAVAVAAAYLTWLAGRLDRLHARTDAARSSLLAQLLRRAAAAEALADRAAASRPPRENGGADRPAASDLARLAAAATTAGAAGGRLGPDRQAVENDLSRALHPVVTELADSRDDAVHAALADVHAAAARVVMARRFYNDAVRDTRALRGRRPARWLRLAGHAPLPGYFEIDDVLPPVAAAALATPR